MPVETAPPSRTNRTSRWIRERSFYPTLAVLIVLFFAALLYNRIVYNIGPGERGVRWSRFGGGTVLDRVYPEGIRLIFPWDRMYIYNIQVHEIHDAAVVLTSNGLPITINYSSRFYPHPGSLPTLHQRYGPNYVDILVKPEVVSALRVVIGNYRPEEIYSRDEAGLLDEIFGALEANLANHYVVAQDVLIKELRLSTEVEKAINNKLVQEQNALAYEHRLKLEESERERKTIEAAGIRSFEDISHVSMLRWRGLDVTEKLAASPNAKIVIVGTGQQQLPIILGGQ